MIEKPQGIRALVWLRSRELLGESRSTSRLFFFGAALIAWWFLILAGSWQAVHTGRIETHTIPDISAAAWPLWALLPLLGGGGGGELVAAHRLAPYPIGPRSIFGAGWFAVVTDMPYIVVLPLVVGLQTAAYGVPGLAAAITFAVGASATGQLSAWAAGWVLAGRKRSGATAVLMTGAVIGLLTAAPHLLGTADKLARLLPSGWLTQASAASSGGHALAWFGWVLLLAAPGPVALAVGPALTRVALGREARGGGSGTTSWGVAGWSTRGSVLRSLATADLKSMTRAVGAQVALAGVLAVPALTRLPGVDFAQVSLVAMGSVAALAAATVLGLNAFAFQAGGASLLLSWPLPPRVVMMAKAISVGGCLAVAQLAVTVVGVIGEHSSSRQLATAVALIVPRTLLLTGFALVWSVRMPASSDYDSLRARIAAPRSVISYGLTAAVCCYVVSQGAVDLPAGLGPLALTAVAVPLLIALTRLASLDLAGSGTERVATSVAG